MVEHDTLDRRMFTARNALEGRLGRSVTLAEISEAVSRTLGRETAFDPSVVARWLKAEQEPKTRAAWAALARALEVDPGWLAFGDESNATMALVGRRDAEPRPPARERPTIPAESFQTRAQATAKKRGRGKRAG